MKFKSAITTAAVGALAAALGPLLVAGASKGGIVGTWAGRIQLDAPKAHGGTPPPSAKVTLQFAPDGTATLTISGEDARTHRARTDVAVAKYTLTGNVLSMVPVRQIVDGVPMKDPPTPVARAMFSDGGRTLRFRDKNLPAMVLTRQ